MNNALELNEMRERAKKLILDVREYADGTKSPVVQELIIAARAFEDGRMRLGVARTYEDDQDPLASK